MLFLERLLKKNNLNGYGDFVLVGILIFEILEEMLF